jgi:hypothetical protein
MTESEFEDAKKFWLMFQARETFKAVHQGCLELVRSELPETSPLYFPLIAGLICLYGKPFKKSHGVEKLPIELVPEKYLAIHNQIIVIRDRLYAHSDADKTVNVGNLYFGELRYVRDAVEPGYRVPPLHIRPEFFTTLMAVLALQMMEKTQDHVDQLGEKFMPQVPPDLGEFLLNIRNKDEPPFKQVEPLWGGKDT